MSRVLRLSGGACLAAIVALFLSPGVLAQASGRPEIDTIFAKWNKRDSPGCSLGIYQEGRIAYERGYGMASLEHDVPITPETVFYVGSLSKQFTAAVAALAIQQGRLSLDDGIRKYLPELPAYADGITVRHLIHHTSGLRDYNTLLSIAGRRGDEAFDNQTVLRITARQKKLNFEPGTEYLYSNTGYTLLALLVERATGVPFAEYAERQIFGPLGMAITHYHTDEGRLVRNRAFAYSPRGSGLSLDTPNNERAGAGGVFTSVRDLLQWDENFYKARVGGAALVSQLQIPGTLSGGRPMSYAWGLQIDTYRGLPIVEHGGSLGGYRAHLMRFPRQHFSVAILCNLGSIAPGTQARQVADVVIASAFTEPKPAPRGGTGSSGGSQSPREDGNPAVGNAQAIADLAGTYRSDEADALFTVAVQDGRLTLRRESDPEPSPLQASGPDEFRFRRHDDPLRP
jgi:CubicO group peptidase (beta-lactamase class C family)